MSLEFNAYAVRKWVDRSNDSCSLSCHIKIIVAKSYLLNNCNIINSVSFVPGSCISFDSHSFSMVANPNTTFTLYSDLDCMTNIEMLIFSEMNVCTMNMLYGNLTLSYYNNTGFYNFKTMTSNAKHLIPVLFTSLILISSIVLKITL